MKRKYTQFRLDILLVCGLALFIIYQCQSTEDLKGVKAISDLEEMELNGKVKSLEEVKYKASRNTKTNEFMKMGKLKINSLHAVYVFNEEGNLKNTTWYDVDGNEGRQEKYEYKPKKKEIVVTSYDAEGEKTSKRIDKYDKKGNKIEHLVYMGDEKEPYRETFKYDEAGNIIKEVAEKADGPIVIDYSYDDKGSLIEQRQTQNDELMMKETFQYDDEGGLIKSEQDERRIVYGGLMYQKFYEKDKEIERRVLEDKKLKNRYEYKYDDYGNEIGFTEYDPDGNITLQEEVKYEYGDTDWLKEIPLNSSGVPKYILEREIEYY